MVSKIKKIGPNLWKTTKKDLFKNYSYYWVDARNRVRSLDMLRDVKTIDIKKASPYASSSYSGKSRTDALRWLNQLIKSRNR